MHPAPSTYAGMADVAAVLVLLTEFAMLRAPTLRAQVRLYAFQSLVVTVLAVFIAATQHIGELYVLALLSFVLK
ncbi:MAG: hydrogenase, partial [Acidimicrobiales bacterium]